MIITRTEISTLADRLYHARTHRSPCEPLSNAAPSLTIQDAYVISEINLKRRLAQGQEALVGKKIGLTSRAVQKQLGVHEPDFGYLTSEMNVGFGEEVSTSGLILPKVEGEVAFVLKKRLCGPGVLISDVFRATDFVLPCIEIIDSRVKDWKIKIQDTIADNASAASFVLGTKPMRLTGLDLRLLGMNLKVNGRSLSTGVGAACLDHPALAVAWLANVLGKQGVTLEPGEVILSGAFGPVVPVSPGQAVEVSIQKLGSVSCFFKE